MGMAASWTGGGEGRGIANYNLISAPPSARGVFPPLPMYSTGGWVDGFCFCSYASLLAILVFDQPTLLQVSTVIIVPGHSEIVFRKSVHIKIRHFVRNLLGRCCCFFWIKLAG